MLTITSEDVIDTLTELFAMGGVPESIRSVNGPEFVARAIQEWLQRLRIETLYVAPRSPGENGYAESFHSKLRDEFLSQERWLFWEFRGSARFGAGFDESEDIWTINPRIGDAEPGTVPIP